MKNIVAGAQRKRFDDREAEEDPERGARSRGIECDLRKPSVPRELGLGTLAMVFRI